MLDNGKNCRKNDKNKTTSQRPMKWLFDKLIDKLIDVFITLATAQTIQHIGDLNWPVLEHLKAVSYILV